MAKVEVEEDIAHLGELANRLASGKNRKSFLKMVHEEYPDKPKPAELAAEDAALEATKPLQAKIDELNAKLAAKEQMDKLQERRKPVAHLAPDHLKKLEQFMVDKGIADYDIALREMTRLDTIASPKPAGRFGRAEMPTPDADKLLYKDPAAFRSKTLHGLIDDLQAGKAI